MGGPDLTCYGMEGRGHLLDAPLPFWLLRTNYISRRGFFVPANGRFFVGKEQGDWRGLLCWSSVALECAAACTGYYTRPGSPTRRFL